jgi:hypothetical protein
LEISGIFRIFKKFGIFQELCKNIRRFKNIRIFMNIWKFVGFIVGILKMFLEF